MDKSILTYKILEHLYHSAAQGYVDFQNTEMKIELRVFQMMIEWKYLKLDTAD